MTGRARQLIAVAGLIAVPAGAVLVAVGFGYESRVVLLVGAVAVVLGCVVGLFSTKVPPLLGRELAAYFQSPIAYVTATVFLVLAGVFFFSSLERYSMLSEKGQAVPGEVMGGMLWPVMVTMIFICPLITMRLLSEEVRSGTIEVLMTAPVTDFEVIISKFLAGLVFYAYLLGMTLIHVLVVWRVGNPDYGPIITMYLGLLLLGAMFLSVGLFVSAFTRNQIVASVVTFVLLMILFMIDGASGYVGGAVKDVCGFVSLYRQSDTFYKGMVDSRHVVYSLSFTGAMLFLTVRAVESRKWR